ncbi:hypothetical protein Bca101_084210 [Brassica carinata]
MSYLTRLLLRGTNSFITSKNSRDVSASTAPAASTSKRKPSLAALVYLVNYEKDPKHIAETFNKACQTEKFRQNLTVYENTVRRLASSNKFELIEEIMEEQSKYQDMSKQGFVARIYQPLRTSQRVQEMPVRNCKRSLPAFNALFNACVNSKKLDLDQGRIQKGTLMWGEELWARMVEKNVGRDIRSYNTRLLGLALEKESEEMVKFLEELKFTAMARGLAGVGEVDEAKIWYHRIENYNFHPMKVVYSSLLPAMCKAGDLEFALELCKDIFTKRILVEEAIVQEVVDALVKGSKQEEAEEIVELANKDGYFKFKLRLSSKE